MRVFGFIAGVTATSGLLYRFEREIRQDAAAARTSMHETAASVDRALSPKQYAISKPVPIKTTGVVEAMKDLWDEEVEKGAKYVLGSDPGAFVYKLFN